MYNGNMNDELHPALSIRLYKDGKCFGPGIAELLSRVEEQRSLRAAASQMHMAYSKAWRIVKETEQALGVKLLISVTGGQHGGGAELTGRAKKLLVAYRTYTKAVQDASVQLFEEVFLKIYEEDTSEA